MIRVDGTSGVTRTGVKAASSLKAELGIWMSPCAKTYKRGLQREKEREWKGKRRRKKRASKRKRKREKGADSEPFLILAERGFKGISAVSRNALNFPPASRREHSAFLQLSHCILAPADSAVRLIPSRLSRRLKFFFAPMFVRCVARRVL